MLLAIDIGNTNIVLGAFEGQSLKVEFRIKTDLARTLDEYQAILFPLFASRLGENFQFSAAIICSVVPPVTSEIVQLCETRMRLSPLVIGPGTKTGLSIKMAEPAAVGSDRVANAVAAKAHFGTPSLVVDFGTATSFDLVSKEGHYLGGAIAPGPASALDALVKNTAKLPKIELAWPKSFVGGSTIAAMQVGSVAGYLFLVDGLIEAIATEIGGIQHVVATGGLGRLFSTHSKKINSYDPHLTLKGMRIIAELNGVSW